MNLICLARNTYFVLFTQRPKHQAVGSVLSSWVLLSMAIMVGPFEWHPWKTVGIVGTEAILNEFCLM